MSPEPEVIYVPELARMLGRTEAAIRSAWNRGAAWLPRPIGMGRRLAWRRADVLEAIRTAPERPT